MKKVPGKFEQNQIVHRAVINASQNAFLDKHGNSVARYAMDITDEMLQAAVRKAIEAGLLPRNAGRDDAHGSKELMRLIVVAAMSANRENELPSGASLYRRHPANTTFSGASDAKHAISTYACS